MALTALLRRSTIWRTRRPVKHHPNVGLHAFVYSGGMMSDLGTFGGSSSTANAINGAGQIVGYASYAGDVQQHAFLYSGGMMTDLGTLGGNTSDAYAINASGQIVGQVSHVLRSRARLPLQQRDDDRPGNSGRRHVQSRRGDQRPGPGRRFLLGRRRQTPRIHRQQWYHVDLNIPSGTGLTISVAFGINDAGQIVARGVNSARAVIMLCC